MEVFDPATDTFRTTGSMSAIRDHHTATLLPDGRVMVVGGGGEGYASSKSADLYDPATGKFRTSGSIREGQAVRWLLALWAALASGGAPAHHSPFRRNE